MNTYQESTWRPFTEPYDKTKGFSDSPFHIIVVFGKAKPMAAQPLYHLTKAIITQRTLCHAAHSELEVTDKMQA